MKGQSWENNRLEAMRMRFQKCAIAVNDARPRHSSNVRILPDNSQFACLATVHQLGVVRYVLRLRIISDKPNRVICGYMIETDMEQIRVLEPHEDIASKYIIWDLNECLLNNYINRRFGPTRFREGLLLGEGLRSPAVDRRKPWASLRVGVLDQFDNLYEQTVRIFVHDEHRDIERSVITHHSRKTGGLYECDDDDPETRRRNADYLNAIGRERAKTQTGRDVARSTGKPWSHVCKIGEAAVEGDSIN